MSLSSASSSLGPPPAYPANGVQPGDELKIYLDDSQGHYKWSIRDKKKRLRHLIQYNSEQATLCSGSSSPLKVQFQEELGSITLPVKVLLENDDRTFILQAQRYSHWTLTISCKAIQETYCLIRRTTGWDIHIDSPEGLPVATLRKNHGETKLGRLAFTTPLSESVALALIFSLSFTISTANARFHRELGIPASTEYDRIEKYGDLNDLRPQPTLKTQSSRSKLSFIQLMRPTSHSNLSSSASSNV